MLLPLILSLLGWVLTCMPQLNLLKNRKVVRPGMEDNLEERYESYSRVVRGHALVSLGLTLFKKVAASPASETKDEVLATPAKKKAKKSKKSKKEKTTKETSEEEGSHCISPASNIPRYRASNFEMILFCQSSHSVSPSSLAFLVQNGFDLNRQVTKGIPYLPGTQGMCLEVNSAVSSRLQSDLQKYNRVLREIIMELLSSKAALVVHNGLLDLMFIYHSFYADLPSKFSTFLTDVADWAESGGLFDTKCLSEYVTRDGASYLSFLFNKSLREQAVLHHLLKDKTPISLKSFSVVMQPRIQLGITPEDPKESSVPAPTAPDAISKLLETLAGDNTTDSIPLEAIFCFNYMFHGHCKDNQYSSSLTSAAPSCPKSHDLTRFLDASLLLAKKRFCNATNPSKIQLTPPPFLLDFFKSSHPSFYKQILETAAKHLPSSYSEPQVNATHSAQYDSFMTGYVFLHFLNHPDPITQIDLTPSSSIPSPGSLAAFLALSQSASAPQKSYRNHLYLMGKKFPLLVARSTFSKCSEAHRKLWHLES
ncbi:hypothetical protein DSO57_1027231 [Entomophthora muscae]|uniref:Uncharacterized protein n=1 Tax=Entomophthora muscae TaxID=34485 RepID=A0ACC2S468_9FUNG|nr:hypothetical protein DSO57_1027231 [Entomophthora muscae]